MFYTQIITQIITNYCFLLLRKPKINNLCSSNQYVQSSDGWNYDLRIICGGDGVHRFLLSIIKIFALLHQYFWIWEQGWKLLLQIFQNKFVFVNLCIQYPKWFLCNNFVHLWLLVKILWWWWANLVEYKTTSYQYVYSYVLFCSAISN